MMKAGKLHGKTVIITGAAGGIGMATAALLGRQGANLVLADIDLPKLERATKGLSSSLLTVKCDITKREDIVELVARAQKKFNKIDILVNNAGIIIPARFEDSKYDDIEKQININLIGTINVTYEVLPALIKNGGGNIVTISSMAGIVPETFSSIYTATKFAPVSYTHLDVYKRQGISVASLRCHHIDIFRRDQEFQLSGDDCRVMPGNRGEHARLVGQQKTAKIKKTGIYRFRAGGGCLFLDPDVGFGRGYFR